MSEGNITVPISMPVSLYNRLYQRASIARDGRPKLSAYCRDAITKKLDSEEPAAPGSPVVSETNGTAASAAGGREPPLR